METRHLSLPSLLPYPEINAVVEQRQEPELINYLLGYLRAYVLHAEVVFVVGYVYQIDTYFVGKAFAVAAVIEFYIEPEVGPELEFIAQRIYYHRKLALVREGSIVRRVAQPAGKTYFATYANGIKALFALPVKLFSAKHIKDIVAVVVAVIKFAVAALQLAVV